MTQLAVLRFLNRHQDHITICKLRRNEQLTPMDLTELEPIFVAEGIAGEADLDRIRGEGGIGVFIRSLVGLEREAAKAALAGFMTGRTLTANQIEFITTAFATTLIPPHARGRAPPPLPTAAMSLHPGDRKAPDTFPRLSW